MNKIAVLFPGQGSQYVGMGKHLYNNYDFAKKTFHIADEVLGYDISKICFEGGAKDLVKTINTQPALLTVSYIMYKVFIEEQEVEPSFLLGHSLGELTALCCSGAIKFEDALVLSKLRATFMSECTEKFIGKMCAVFTENIHQVNDYINIISSEHDPLVISNYNSVNQVVVSGSVENISRFRELANENGIKTVLLKTSGAFHSPFMNLASQKFFECLKKIKFYKMNIPVVSNVTARIYESEDKIIDNLSRQIVSPVRWLESILFLKDVGINLFLECGPKNVLKGLTKNILPSENILSLDLEDDLNCLGRNIK